MQRIENSKQFNLNTGGASPFLEKIELLEEEIRRLEAIFRVQC